MSDLPRYELGSDIVIATVIDRHNTEKTYADNEVIENVHAGNLGVGLIITDFNRGDSNGRPYRFEIVMDEKQAKGVVKALNMQIKRLRRL